MLTSKRSLVIWLIGLAALICMGGAMVFRADLVVLESISGLKVKHRMEGNRVRIFVEGLNVESAKEISSIRLTREGATLFLQVRSRLVPPFKAKSSNTQITREALRTKWGSDLRSRVSFAEEFDFENLPSGKYENLFLIATMVFISQK